MRTMASVVAAGALVGAAHADFILVNNSQDNRVMLLNAFDGSIVNSNFLDIGAAASAAGVSSSTGIEVLEVNNEFWVSDQLADRIWRFDHSGGFIGSIGDDQFNNIRGMERVGNTVYAALGSDSSSYTRGFVTIDATTGMVTGNFNGRDGADTSYWDILDTGSELLVTNSDTGNDGIERYSYGGTYLGNLVSSDGAAGVDFPQQMTFRGSNGNILVGGFSPPSGVYEYMMDGTEVGIVAALDLGPRAAIELGNGEILWSNGNFLATDSYVVEEGGSYRWFTLTSVPAPSALGLLGLGGLIGVRRRR
jgi:MYXO-CTERM domain-containing protein